MKSFARIASILIFACSIRGVLAPLQAAEPIFLPDSKPELVLQAGAGEGPAWHPDQGLFFSGHEGITLMKADRTSKLYLRDARSNGLLFDHQGRLLICQPGFRRVSRLNIGTGKLDVLTANYQGKQYNQPNDISVDSKGRIYFSDPKYGERDSMEMLDDSGRKIEGVYRIDLDGSVSRIITHEVDRPNGVLVTPDDRYLFVADNNNNEVGGARKLWRFDLNSNGEIDPASMHLIYDWKTGRGPDGMSIDRSGRLYVAGGRNDPVEPYETADEFKGGVYVLSMSGQLLDFVPIPRDEVTNCAFGGPDLCTLYITAGGTLWSIRTTVPGRVVWPK